ncbi:MAG TPA: metal-sulfur cluster assembly factor [Chitinophagaceae bacterium]
MSVISNNNLKCTVALAALGEVYDPEIGLDVVSLGLIYQIDFDEEAKKIYLTMTLTTQFCPMGESIVDNVKGAVEGAYPGYEVQVNLTFSPPWSYERISEEGRAFLGR